MAKQLVRLLKGLLLGCLAFLGLTILGLLGLFGYVQWQYHVPDEHRARDLFEAHRTEFLQLARLLKTDGHYEYVVADKWFDKNLKSSPLSLERRRLFKSLGAKFVIVRDDGAIDFAIWGFGGAIISDRYLGIRYQPRDFKGFQAGWGPIAVKTLRGSELPQDKGSVASGLYEMELEPEWFIYRLEYQE